MTNGHNRQYKSYAYCKRFPSLGMIEYISQHLQNVSEHYFKTCDSIIHVMR